ncbi:MAG: hypothetical protein EHM23_21340 [Acidobacteria bacterium]|nr:MAG: hypothetical protein EHM23_21340 [Acidobacteriota bacterium]
MRRLAFVLLAILACSPIRASQLVKTVAYDYSALYESLNPSIAKIHADSGTGSGFLVDAAGLFATNHHVVKNTRFLAVQFSDGKRVKAEIIALSPRYDIAIVKVNSQCVTGMRPLALLPESDQAGLRPGTPVAAFGSPLSQTFLMTQGIISKVEQNVLLGDFLIQPGNSGGPLVDLEGRVVGINTFAEGGISGAVHVHLLKDLLKSPELKDAGTIEPPPDPLQNTRGQRYPTEVLKNKVLEEKLDLKTYQIDGGKFVVTAITPVLVAKLQIQDDLQQAANRYKRRGKKIRGGYEPIDAPFYEWHRNAVSSLDYAVTFEVKPDFGLTGGSKWAMAFAAIAGPQTVASTPVNYEYKAEFQDFKLYVDGKLVEPITPGRQITEMGFVRPLASFIDEAYSGMYVYSPETFLAGEEFRLEIYDAREPEKVHKSVTLKSDSKLIKQIRSDFAGSEEQE